LIFSISLYISIYNSSHLDEVRHGEVHDVVAPGQLENDIRVEEVIALVETSRKAVEVALFQEPGQELLGDLGVLRFGCVFHGVFEETILLA